MRRSVSRLDALIRHNVLLVAREPGPLLSRVVLPLVLVSLLRPLYQTAAGQRAGTVQAVGGVLVMFSLLGMSLVGTALMTERVWRTADRLRATAAGRVELLVGKALPALGLLLLQQGLILGYGAVALGLHVAAPALLSLVVMVWSVTLLSLGAMIGALSRSPAELAAAVDIGSLVLTAFAGALAPLAMMPGWARAIAPASPGYWAMRAVRAALVGQVGPAIGASVVLAGVAAVAATIATVRIGRDTRRGAFS